jgi:hypothetical protein
MGAADAVGPFSGSKDPSRTMSASPIAEKSQKKAGTTLAPGRTACLGLLRRKECWLPSRRAWALGLLVFVMLGGVAFFGIQPFLAMTSPVPAESLVVEGWIADDGLAFALREFEGGPYQRIYATGGPVTRGSHLSEYRTFAEIAAASLKRLGLKDEQVVTVGGPHARMDRTYASAVALRRWLAEHGQRVKAINVVTTGAHARRTWLVYKKIFGGETAVGVISVPNPDYDSERWWEYSAGWKDLVGETVGYLSEKVASRVYVDR